VILRPVERRERRSELPATLEAVEQFCAEFQLWRLGACTDFELFFQRVVAS